MTGLQGDALLGSPLGHVWPLPCYVSSLSTSTGSLTHRRWPSQPSLDSAAPVKATISVTSLSNSAQRRAGLDLPGDSRLSDFTSVGVTEEGSWPPRRPWPGSRYVERPQL